MNRFLLLFVCLFTGMQYAHASSLDPLADGYTLNVGNTVLTNANATFNSATGVLMFTDNTATYTFAEVSAPPLLNALSVTRTCLLVNLGGCDSATLSITDASVLNGTLTGNLLVGASVQAAARGGVPTLVFASTGATIGLQSAVVGYQDPTQGNSPVPEPGTVSLVLSGVMGMACAARRRFAAA